MNDWLHDDTSDYRDTPAFLKYRDEIEALFRTHRILTVPEIHRLVTPIRAWTMDVLDALDLIEHGAKPVRYELYTPVEKQGQWMGMAFHRKADRTRPAVESFPGGAA